MKVIKKAESPALEKPVNIEVDQTFSDRKKMAPLAIDSIMSCVDFGLLDGYPDGEYKPKQNMIRVEAAVVIHRLLFKSGLISTTIYSVHLAETKDIDLRDSSKSMSNS
ncbi:S-layer homology domain-containing protein [Paenibacillus thiaminolyticus]|uniref:S-layer homology domain-containing protein n=1 Tax=Paenibacillus thiaminolyticus TaxID=49283 RepID=A0A3A3GHF7_PANTH|nr:S-layer homology domain-containing protein [Paenibacillus thiaminolyticus]RJG21319.1 S-layer homology domain-containing protein [Paenibacillus thiaminolyticus]